MGKKLKFAIIALLGFSTACSSAKKSQQSPDPETEPQPTEVKENPRIRVMYGTRPPYPIKSVEEVQMIIDENQSNNPEQQSEADENPAKTE